MKEWRIRFAVEGREVRVSGLVSGYRASQLDVAREGEDPLLAVHREFRTGFGPD